MIPADPLGCLGCKLGKSLPFFKILLKEKQFKVDGCLACVAGTHDLLDKLTAVVF